MFDLEAILDAEDSIISEFQTKFSFFVEFETSFCLLPDGKTILGVKFNLDNNYEYKYPNENLIKMNPSILAIEDITSPNKNLSRTYFERHNKTISTVLYNEDQNILLAKHNDEKVVQYQQMADQSWKV